MNANEKYAFSKLNEPQSPKYSSSPKQKGANSTIKLTRKQSQANMNVQPLTADEYHSYFNSNYFGLFAMSCLSKSLFLTSSLLSGEQPFVKIRNIIDNNVSLSSRKISVQYFLNFIR